MVLQMLLEQVVWLVSLEYYCSSACERSRSFARPPTGVLGKPRHTTGRNNTSWLRDECTTGTSPDSCSEHPYLHPVQLFGCENSIVLTFMVRGLTNRQWGHVQESLAVTQGRHGSWTQPPLFSPFICILLFIIGLRVSGRLRPDLPNPPPHVFDCNEEYFWSSVPGWTSDRVSSVV